MECINIYDLHDDGDDLLRVDSCSDSFFVTLDDACTMESVLVIWLLVKNGEILFSAGTF